MISGHYIKACLMASDLAIILIKAALYGDSLTCYGDATI